MYLYKEQSKELLREMADSLSEVLRDKTDFMIALIEEDDWSMVIKSHALIESLITELIVTKVEEPTLKGVVERLPLSDEQIGKLRIAKDYELLPRAERTFIKRLSQLRNHLVHKVENINFTFEGYVSTLNKEEREHWQKAITWFEQGREVTNSWSEATLDNPRTAFWLSVLMFALNTGANIEEIRGMSRVRIESEATMKELMEGLV